MAHIEQVRVTKLQQELRKALKAGSLQVLGRTTQSIQEWDRDFLLRDHSLFSLSLSLSFLRTKHPEAAPTSMRPKLCSPISPAGKGGWAAQSMDFLTKKCKENLFFTFGSVTEKKQFQVAKSKTKVPQGMGRRGCSQVTTSKLNPQGGVSLEEFRMSEQPRQHNRAGGLEIISSQAKA